MVSHYNDQRSTRGHPLLNGTAYFVGTDWQQIKYSMLHAIVDADLWSKSADCEID